jgi:hypothetical protein
LNAVTPADDYSPDSPNGVKKAETETESGGTARNAEATEVKPAPKDISEIISSIPKAVAILNGNGEQGVGKLVAEHLEKMGVQVEHIGNAKHSDYRSSNIIYPVNSSDKEKDRMAATLLAQLCGVSSSLVTTDRLATYPSLIVGHDYQSLLKRLENSYAQLQ